MASRKSAALLLSGAARALSNQHGFAAAIGSGSVAEQRLHSPSTFSRYAYSSSRSADGPKKILGVFFAAHEYAKNPEFLGCVENALGIREWLESKGHKYVVTSDKDGPNSGKAITPFALQELVGYGGNSGWHYGSIAKAHLDLCETSGNVVLSSVLMCDFGIYIHSVAKAHLNLREISGIVALSSVSAMKIQESQSLASFLM